MSKTLRIVVLACALVAIALTATTNGLTPRAQAAPSVPTDRYLVKAKPGSDLSALEASVTSLGGKVLGKIPQLNLLVVQGMGQGNLNRAALESDANFAGMGPDTIHRLVRPSMQKELWGAAFNSQMKLSERIKVNAPNLAGKQDTVLTDPSFNLPNTMWSVYRMNAYNAWDWDGGSGQDSVLVGVADTGLDYTHIDLADNIVHVQDFTALNEPYGCTYFGGFSDQDAADFFGGPVTTDWNGHGSWIGGNIAGVLNDTGMNGIVPNTKLVALKISEWCGIAWESTILTAMLYAGDNLIDVVNISFGGYADRSTPEGDFSWKQIKAAVKYANSKGTAIVSSAGNEHLRLGKAGKVVSHGILTIPGDPLADYYGLYETPAGVPGVVAVSALGNVTERPSATCPPDTIGSPTDSNNTCKPASDLHQPFGRNRQNQLTYYSNYGKRIDVSAPGGSRKFNLPSADRGGTPGFPYTAADDTTVFQIFSTTSNWALQIPCFDLSSIPGFTSDCYTSIQGTSMAAPHVAAGMAQVMSAAPWLRRNPKALLTVIKNTGQQLQYNRTPGLDATDYSPGDRTEIDCPTGYCHLGGPPVPNNEAYGEGMIDTNAAIASQLE